MNWAQELRQFSGIPYRHQGHSRDGADCIGLVRLVWQEILDRDLSCFDIPSRPYNPPARSLIRGLNAAFTRTDTWANQSVVVFRGIGSGAQHCGITAVEGKMRYLLHADRGLGQVQFTQYLPNPSVHIYGIWS